MRKITLSKTELYTIADKLTVAYASKFSSDTISRATTFIEGETNPSRNLMYGVIINTMGKAGKLCDIYSKATAQSLVKLTIYGLANPKPTAETTDAF